MDSKVLVQEVENYTDHMLSTRGYTPGASPSAVVKDAQDLIDTYRKYHRGDPVDFDFLGNASRTHLISKTYFELLESGDPTSAIAPEKATKIRDHLNGIYQGLLLEELQHRIEANQI